MSKSLSDKDSIVACERRIKELERELANQQSRLEHFKRPMKTFVMTFKVEVQAKTESEALDRVRNGDELSDLLNSHFKTEVREADGIRDLKSEDL